MTQIQQIIRKGVARGIHVNTSIEFCATMVDHTENLIRQVHEGRHIAFSEFVEDIEDLKRHLLKSYHQQLLMYKSTLVNLTFSEN